jgi:hypothetical protein
MIERQTDNENIESIYSYKDENGERFWTPNPILAQSRAETFGTETVWVETYEVPPLPDKKS